ncbi:Ig-like domain-containing protein [Natronomonas amylolytica]|uniref:Ig-like domain-containing protein n=1 Tax=Natronomonas amylolytica TaxID=3108498 RepID=UPI00300B7FFE
MTRPDYVPDDAKDITEYGAVSNPDDPNDQAVYEGNRDAIIDACNAAGSEGSIYVPEGTYYFGQGSGNHWIRHGAHTPPGISIYGDGPEASVLGMHGHGEKGEIHTLFNHAADEYTGTNEHTVTYQEIQFHGQAPKLPNLYDSEPRVGQSGVSVQSDNSGLDFEVKRAYFYQMYGAGIDVRGSLTIDFSTFEESGIKLENDADAVGDTSINHHIVARPESSNKVVMRDSEFINTSGNAIDAAGSGPVECYRCWGSGLGTGWCKLSAYDLRLENVYMEPFTQELQDLTAGDDIGDGYNGRRGPFYRLDGDPSVVPVAELYDVEIRGTTREAIEIRERSSDLSGDVELHGDMIAFHDIAKADGRDEAIRAVGEDFVDSDIGRLSVHDSDTDAVLDITGNGSIETLKYGNSGSAGSTDDVEILDSESGADPFQPDVPSQDEVGVNALSDTGQEDDGTTTDSPLFNDWTPQWESDHDDWSVVSGDEFAGGSALAFEHDGQTRTRYAISCDEIGTPADVEVLDKFRVPAFTDDESLGFHARVNLRSSSSSAGENGYWLELENREGAFRLAKYTDGNLTTMGRFGTPEEDTFYYRRFRAEGNELKAKVWKASENEPSEWDIETTDSDHADGWVGLGSFDTGLVETDIFSVATDGGTAPHLNSDTSPGVTWQNPTDGKTVSGTTVLQIDAADQEDNDDSLTVEYRIDDGTWQSASYNADTGYYEDTWDTTGTADGDRTLEAKATDSAGNSANTSVTVTVDNSLSVETIGVENVTDASTMLVGNVTSFGGADGATCYFEWREQGTETWNRVGEQTRSSLGEFSADLTGLEAGTSYEFQAAAETTDRATGSIRSFDTGTDSTSLSIDRFALSDKSNPSWSWYEVDWAVSDVDGELDTVVSELRYNGNTVTAESTNVSGETASFTHEVRVQGDVDEIRLSVNDTSNDYISESKKI